MEENELSTMLREADRIDRLPPVDSMVNEGIRRGRSRLRTRRLTALGVVGTSIAALATVVALTAPTIGPGVTVAPAAQPTSKPAPPEPSKQAAKDKGKLPSVHDLTKIMKANLPGGLTMADVQPTQKRGNTDIVFELVDEHGRGWAGGGVARTSWASWEDHGPCKAAQGCTETKIDEGTLRITRDLEKVGEGVWYWLRRTDGTAVWFGQANAFEGNGPVTRDRNALSDKQAIKLITAPEWQELGDRLPKEQPAGDRDIEGEKRDAKEKAKR